MKAFFKSAFFINLLMIISFGILTYMSGEMKLGYVTTFFGCCTIVFTMILPACSTKN